MDAEVAVIGVGSMGSMAMWQLAKKGVSVIGFEQFGIGHDQSAAGGDTRIFRTSYKEGADYVPILLEAYNEWRNLEKETGEDLLTITTGLVIGDANSDSMKNVIKSIEDYDLGHRILSKEKAEKEFPQHILDPGEIIIVDEQAGYVRSQRAIMVAVERARELGAIVYEHSKVEKIEESADGKGIIVLSNGQEYRVGKVVVTVGPWINKLFPALEEHVEVRKLIGTWFAARDMEQYSANKFPTFGRNSSGMQFYGVPTIDGTMLKVSLSTTSKDRIDDPDELNRNITTGELEKARRVIRTYLPDLYSEPVRVNGYMEGFTTDGHPIIGKVPGQEGIVIAGGFSGHGFKMAAVIGKILADMATDVEPAFKMDKFSPARFIGDRVVK